MAEAMYFTVPTIPQFLPTVSNPAAGIRGQWFMDKLGGWVSPLDQVNHPAWYAFYLLHVRANAGARQVDGAGKGLHYVNTVAFAGSDGAFEHVLIESEDAGLVRCATSTQ